MSQGELPRKPKRWLTVECSGTPYEIGHKHGSVAAAGIAGSIKFYATLFQKNANKSWSQVQEIAKLSDASIASNWPRYYEEMQGIAAAAQVSLLDIVALNCRTEIAYGLSQNQSDGCTALWVKTDTATFQGQNWDWNPVQRENLIYLILHQAGLPTVKMITEAGIIGKIGMNSSGVGVTFNALQVPGMEPTKLPAHLGLRMALEARSSQEAIETLEKAGGMAACAYILIGDAKQGAGLEFTCRTSAIQLPDKSGKIIHTNHCLLTHEGMEERMLVKDSPARFVRAQALLDTFRTTGGGLERFSKIFEDEAGAPAGSINREGRPGDEFETLFNIVMDLSGKVAIVRVGRPTEAEESFIMDFD